MNDGPLGRDAGSSLGAERARSLGASPRRRNTGGASEAAVLEELLGCVAENQRKAIMLQLVLAGAALVAGISTPLLSNLLVAHDPKWLTLSSGAFIASLSGFPLVAVRSTQDRIAAYEALRRLLVLPGIQPDALDRARQFLDRLIGAK